MGDRGRKSDVGGPQPAPWSWAGSGRALDHRPMAPARAGHATVQRGAGSSVGFREAPRGANCREFTCPATLKSLHSLLDIAQSVLI
jgi:hypothetical protein